MTRPRPSSRQPPCPCRHQHSAHPCPTLTTTAALARKDRQTTTHHTLRPGGSPQSPTRWHSGQGAGHQRPAQNTTILTDARRQHYTPPPGDMGPRPEQQHPTPPTPTYRPRPVTPPSCHRLQPTTYKARIRRQPQPPHRANNMRRRHLIARTPVPVAPNQNENHPQNTPATTATFENSSGKRPPKGVS